MGSRFLVDLVYRARRRAALNRVETKRAWFTNLDLVAHAQDHFPYGYHFANRDFRPSCYGIAMVLLWCIILKKVHTYKDNAHSNHIATGSNS